MEIDYFISKQGKYDRLDVSPCGKHIRRLKTGHVYVQDKNIDGYLTIRVGGRKHTRVTVHSIVAEAYLGKRPQGMVIDHIDRNKENNHFTNLRYCTCSENSRNISKEQIELATKRIILAQKQVADTRRGVRKSEWRF